MAVQPCRRATLVCEIYLHCFCNHSRSIWQSKPHISSVLRHIQGVLCILLYETRVVSGEKKGLTDRRTECIWAHFRFIWQKKSHLSSIFPFLTHSRSYSLYFSRRLEYQSERNDWQTDGQTVFWLTSDQFGKEKLISLFSFLLSDTFKVHSFYYSSRLEYQSKRREGPKDNYNYS